MADGSQSNSFFGYPRECQAPVCLHESRRLKISGELPLWFETNPQGRFSFHFDCVAASRRA